MKRLAFALTVCLCSCTSMRFTFATPSADSSVYLERSLHDVLSGNLSGEEAYNGGTYFKRFHIVSEVYFSKNLENGNTSDYHAVMFDESNNKITVNFSNEFRREYDIWRNYDFDPRKKYRVKYTLGWTGPRSGFFLAEDRRIEVVSVEDLLTYTESEKKRYQLAQEEEREKNLQKKSNMDTMYENALKSNGVDLIVEYIKANRWKNYFNEDSYVEIARRITNNRNVLFKKIYTAQNPYAFDKNIVYYCDTLVVENFIQKQIIAYIIGDGNFIVVEKVPDIKKIGRYIFLAYLRYSGSAIVTWSNGRTKELPSFDLIYYY
jgi:hypothetical protein